MLDHELDRGRMLALRLANHLVAMGGASKATIPVELDGKSYTVTVVDDENASDVEMVSLRKTKKQAIEWMEAASAIVAVHGLRNGALPWPYAGAECCELVAEIAAKAAERRE